MAFKQTLALSFLCFSMVIFAKDKGEKLSEIKTFKVCGRPFKLEVAKNDADRSRGLMYRKNIPGDEGMIFVFEAAESQVFWMKNVPIALDIIFFDEQGKLINSMTMKSESPLVQDMFLQRYASERPSKFVVELKDGLLKKMFSDAQLKSCRLSPLPKI
ncbi:MAG: DUF192 domain-containing protein [Bdellovibrionota bacterium]